MEAGSYGVRGVRGAAAARGGLSPRRGRRMMLLPPTQRHATPPSPPLGAWAAWGECNVDMWAHGHVWSMLVKFLSG